VRKLLRSDVLFHAQHPLGRLHVLAKGEAVYVDFSQI
jgi:hypothetical protein